MICCEKKLAYFPLGCCFCAHTALLESRTGAFPSDAGDSGAWWQTLTTRRAAGQYGPRRPTAEKSHWHLVVSLPRGRRAKHCEKERSGKVWAAWTPQRVLKRSAEPLCFKEEKVLGRFLPSCLLTTDALRVFSSLFQIRQPLLRSNTYKRLAPNNVSNQRRCERASS